MPFFFFAFGLGRTPPLFDGSSGSSSLTGIGGGSGAVNTHRGRERSSQAAPGGGSAAETPGAAGAGPSPSAFPATRTHLWDRTQIGPVTVVDLKVRLV